MLEGCSTVCKHSDTFKASFVKISLYFLLVSRGHTMDRRTYLCVLLLALTFADQAEGKLTEIYLYFITLGKFNHHICKTGGRKMADNTPCTHGCSNDKDGLKIRRKKKNCKQ